MNDPFSRRAFLRSTLTGAALAAGQPLLAASDPPAGSLLAGGKKDAAAFSSRVESLARLLETTPRDQVLEAVAREIGDGASDRDVLAALMLAGVRDVQPRPTVGFKFHAVLAVISYHLIGSELSKRDRWLPVFWGIDYFKAAQADDASQGDWKLGPVDESSVPSADRAGVALVEAMERWNEAMADTAAAAVARHLEHGPVFELFYPLGARDFRSIGHKAIYVMCAQRVLDLAGWHHAEPVLRSLAYALLMHEDGNPADRDDPADRPWRRNNQIAGKIRKDWRDGQPASDATTELLAVLRTGSSEDAADAVIERLNHGAAPSSVWDAIFCGAAEMQLRAPNIVSLHAATTSRALHYAYRTTTEDHTRKLLLLQNAAMLPMFRDGAGRRGSLQDAAIDKMEPIAPQGSDELAIGGILESLGGQRRLAAQKVFGYLHSGRSARPLVEGIRRLVAVKGNGAHDFKFTSTALECFQHVSEPWRDRYLACGAMHFNGPDERDSAIVGRTRDALGR